MSKLTLAERIDLLTGGARYDASCASSGNRQQGAGPTGGVCHSWSADGRCVSLLKMLLSNACVYDCAYCVNRRTNDIPRASLTPEEMAELTVAFYRRNYIEGLFLSSAVVGTPDYTMELMLATARLLREEHGFGGYLHFKLIPGADPQLVSRIGRYVDRVSVNIELPTQRSLALIAPDKSREGILSPMKQVRAEILSVREERRRSRKAPAFAPAGQTTQLLVGASPENDRQILHLAAGLYRRMDLKRVYYSAYVPVSRDNRLPALREPPLLREHRLYQADWLLRLYGFSVEEILDEENPHLDPRLDPKAAWALRNLHLFPVEITKADYEMLLRVPGIGVRSANRILRARREQHLRWEDLPLLGLVLKRARWFITVGGRPAPQRHPGPLLLERNLLESPRDSRPQQLSLFGEGEAESGVLSGEL